MAAVTTFETAQEVAEIAVNYFGTLTRDSGETITTLKETRPQWLQDLVMEAHGDFLPDDWRYDCIESALHAIADGTEDAHEFADSQVDVYNGARLAWLSSNLRRPSYCDEAADELALGEDLSITERIGFGQYVEACEVFGLVLAELESLTDEELETPELT